MNNFSNSTTAYVCDVNSESILENLEQNSELAVTWFEKNYMKLNTDKCYLPVSGTKHEHVWVKLGKDKIWDSSNSKLLVVEIDNGLKFDEYVSNICLTANRKLSSLTILSRFLSLEKRRILFKAFIESEFKYCPLLWIFHEKQANYKLTGVMNVLLE